jgi:hypothetical protein
MSLVNGIKKIHIIRNDFFALAKEIMLFYSRNVSFLRNLICLFIHRGENHEKTVKESNYGR